MSCQRPMTVGVDYSRINYMRNVIDIYVSARCMSIVTYLFLSGLYNKTHFQSVYSAIKRKLKPGKIVIINLFRRRISLYSPSLPDDHYMFNLR